MCTTLQRKCPACGGAMYLTGRLRYGRTLPTIEVWTCRRCYAQEDREDVGRIVAECDTSGDAVGRALLRSLPVTSDRTGTRPRTAGSVS